MDQYKKLLKEDRWSRVYETTRHPLLLESKFKTDGLSVAFHQLRSDWESWKDSERFAFLNAYRYKPTITADDEKIIEFLMASTDERVQMMIALLSTRHPDKKMVAKFLVARLNSAPEHLPNFLQALTVLGDSDTTSAVHACFRRGWRIHRLSCMERQDKPG